MAVLPFPAPRSLPTAPVLEIAYAYPTSPTARAMGWECGGYYVRKRPAPADFRPRTTASEILADILTGPCETIEGARGMLGSFADCGFTVGKYSM